MAPRPPRTLPDHPRSRGVYEQEFRRTYCDKGSSPLARGLRRHRGRRRRARRIIPARAGFTCRRWCGPGSGRDHPRSRGVYQLVRFAIHFAHGSSPLARGLHRVASSAGRMRRIIPARAGFTTPRSTPPGAPWDHPRSRGVYGDSSENRLSLLGSSPLARGLRRLE